MKYYFILTDSRDAWMQFVYLPTGDYVSGYIRDLQSVGISVERRQFRHLDEVAEASLLHDVVRHVELEVRRLLGEYRRPCVEAADVLLLQRLRTQVLEQQVQFRQRVADGRA